MSDYRPDIWRLQAQFDTQGLIEALKDEDAGYRKRAASALRALGAADAVPALRVALVNEQDPDTRVHIAAALDALADDSQEGAVEEAPVPEKSEAEQLIEKLDDPDPDVVIQTARRLGDLNDKVAVEPLVNLFNNAKVSIRVRLAVAEALLKLESAPVEVTLLAVLRHSDWHIRRNGAAILGQLQAEWAVEPLIRALKDPHPIVRKTARAALKHIGTPEALEAIGKSKSQSQQDQPKPRPKKPAKPSGGQKRARPAAPSSGLLKRVPKQTDELPPTTAHEDPTIPVGVNRDELKRRMMAQKAREAQEATEKAEAKAETQDEASAAELSWPKPEKPPEIHLNPTQPLDPRVVEAASRQREYERRLEEEAAKEKEKAEKGDAADSEDSEAADPDEAD